MPKNQVDQSSTRPRRGLPIADRGTGDRLMGGFWIVLSGLFAIIGIGLGILFLIIIAISFLFNQLGNTNWWFIIGLPIALLILSFLCGKVGRQRIKQGFKHPAQGNTIAEPEPSGPTTSSEEADDPNNPYLTR